MSSRLSKILDVIQAGMPAIPDLAFARGWKAIAENGKPPRIVWKASSDTFGAAMASSFNPKPIMTRFAGVEAHCWGKDEEMAEELAHQVITALHNKLGSNQTLVMGSGQWITQDEKAGWIKYGEVYRLNFSVGIPVTKAPWALAHVQDVRFDASEATDQDGVLTAGESHG